MSRKKIKKSDLLGELNGPVKEKNANYYPTDWESIEYEEEILPEKVKTVWYTISHRHLVYM